MKRAFVLISLVVAGFGAQACSTFAARTVANDVVLKGVSTIYVCDPAMQFYVQRALAKELPQVRVVADENTADATLELNENGPRGARTLAIVRRRNGRSIVVHEGIAGISFPNESVSDFIRAWRSTNAGTPNVVLGGARSVYVDESVGSWVLGPINHALPDVRLASSAADADVILKFEIANPRGMPATSASASTGPHDRPISVPTSVETSSTGSTVVVRAVNRANGSSLVLYDGFTEYMGAHLGPNFVSAWRKANS